MPFETGLIDVCLRTFAIYLFLLFSFRILGKREVSQFTPFDLVLIMVLANAVQNGMVGGNNSLQAAVAAGAVLMLANYGLNRLLRVNPRLRRALEGTPTLLIRHGRVEWTNLAKENLELDTLKEAIREHGMDGVKEVDLAVLERDGSISVIGLHSDRAGRGRQKQKRKMNPRVRV